MKSVMIHQLDELAHEDSKNEILLDTKPHTRIHIATQNNKTIIKLPFGNRFDIVNEVIIIHKNQSHPQ